MCHFSSFPKKLQRYIGAVYPLITLILCVFNARSSSWLRRDSTTAEDTHLEALTSLHNFHQLISEPTHLLPQSNSFIDLILTDQRNLDVNCGQHASLILSPLLIFSSTVSSLLMKDALSSALYASLNCWIVPIMISHKRYFLATYPKLQAIS